DVPSYSESVGPSQTSLPKGVTAERRLCRSSPKSIRQGHFFVLVSKCLLSFHHSLFSRLSGLKNKYSKCLYILILRQLAVCPCGTSALTHSWENLAELQGQYVQKPSP